MKKTIISILNDLKKVFFILFLIVFLLFIVCYHYKEYIYQIITMPITGVFNKTYQNLFVYTSIFESFTADLSLSLFSSLLLSYPVLLACIYWFISKSLYRKEKMYFIAILISSLLFVICGVLLSYCFLLPHFIKYFAFDVNNAMPMFKIGEYISSFFYLIFAISVIIQFPFILILLSKVGLIKKNILQKYRKHAIVIIFVVSAIITPPDVFSQIVIALFLMIIYEITNCIIKKI